jgi:hypothetical protein
MKKLLSGATEDSGSDKNCTVSTEYLKGIVLQDFEVYVFVCHLKDFKLLPLLEHDSLL